MNQPSLKKVTITINTDTWERIKDTAPSRERSKFIDQALRIYLANFKKEILRKQLKKEALGSVAESMKVAKEWFHLDREVWKKIN